MARRDNLGLAAVRSEGIILPPSVLRRIQDQSTTLGGLSPDDFGLSGTRIREAASQAWNALQAPWRNFQNERAKLPASDPGTGMTRRTWLLQVLKTLDYGTLEANRESLHSDGREFAISHVYGHVPIHLVGSGLDLDKRATGVTGAAVRSPHGLVQQFLNSSDDHLWGFVSNGLKWRLLRDDASLSRLSMVEFDLEAIFEGQLYDEFLLFYLTCHQSRVQSERPEECWLEKWHLAAGEEGKRALNSLRGGVEKSIVTLGQGFIAHSENGELRRKLREGELDKQDYYRQLLRQVYRLLFLFVAEDRDVLLDPNAEPGAKQLYLDNFSTARIRRMAEQIPGSERHGDVYRQLQLILQKLGCVGGCPELGLPALGSFLFSNSTAPDLDQAQISNWAFLSAIRQLATTVEVGRRTRIDYKNLGSEELGSVYESLLELHPAIDLETYQFELRSASGNERKTTGSYYTPDALVQCLLDSALEPVVEHRLKEAPATPEGRAKALLELKIIDPAVGSGHFLIAAAHRLAGHVARVRAGDDEPSPNAKRRALREVIGNCLYGIDINPMAAELCKVALWMESLEPGKPLSFLEHHIAVGNSLLGATPDMLKDGIPDKAFDSIADPIRKAELKKRNKIERGGQHSLYFNDIDQGVSQAASSIRNIESAPVDSIEDVRRQEGWFNDFTRSREFEHHYTAADLLLANFFPGVEDAYLSAFVGAGITTETIRRAKELTDDQKEEVRNLRVTYRFLHPHLAFPRVFEEGGFDVVIGNPPWERVKLQEKEFFAGKDEAVVNARNASERRKLIDALQATNPRLHNQFLAAKAQAEGESAILRLSGRFPLAGRGDINTYAVFTELFRSFLGPKGRAGIIVPTGIATDDTTKFFFADLIETKTLASLYDFENGMRESDGDEDEETEGDAAKPKRKSKRAGSDDRLLFADVDSRFKFSLVTMTGAEVQTASPQFAFFCHRVTDLSNPGKVFGLTSEDIALLNPNTRTCPVFRTERDAEITKAIYKRVPVLIREGDDHGNPWGVNFGTMFHMSNDSGLFRTREEFEAADAELVGNTWKVPETVAVNVTSPKEMTAGVWLPLYEAKMFHQFDHRFATGTPGSDDTEKVAFVDMSSAEKADADQLVSGRYWVAEAEVATRTSKENATPPPPDICLPYHHQGHCSINRLPNNNRNDCQAMRTCEPAARQVAWMMCFRDIVRATDIRTTLVTLLPKQYGLGHTASIIRWVGGSS